MKKAIVALLFIPLLFTACKKDDDKAGIDPAAMPGTKWKLVASHATYDSYPDMDVYANMQACQKDNIMTFNSDETITSDEGATKCNTSDPQTYTAGHWEFKSGNTQLYVTGFEEVYGISEITADILQLDANTLKLKYVVTALGVTATTTTTYNKVD